MPTTKTGPKLLEDPTPTDSVAPVAPTETILTRAAILAATDLKTERCFVPEWGGTVIVRCLTGIERDAYEAGIVTQNGQSINTSEYNLTNLRAKLVARTIVDEKGARLFSDEDVEALGRKSASALDRVFAVAQRLSGLSTEDVSSLERQLGNELSAGSGSS